MTNDLGFVLIVVVIVCAWVVAEFRARRRIRLVVGVTCILLLCLGLYCAINSADLQVHAYRVCFQLVDRRLAQHQEKLVKQAVESYVRSHEEQIRLDIWGMDRYIS